MLQIIILHLPNQNHLKNSKHTDHTKSFPGHNIFKFLLILLLLLLYCMYQMLNKSNKNIYIIFFNESVLVNTFYVLPLTSLQRKKNMFQLLVELNVVDLTYKNVRERVRHLLCLELEFKWEWKTQDNWRK